MLPLLLPLSPKNGGVSCGKVTRRRASVHVKSYNFRSGPCWTSCLRNSGLPDIACSTKVNVERDRVYLEPLTWDQSCLWEKKNKLHELFRDFWFLILSHRFHAERPAGCRSCMTQICRLSGTIGEKKPKCRFKLTWFGKNCFYTRVFKLFSVFIHHPSEE